ncbi:MAG: ssDNA-binding domain-containing protein [Desulfovibrio sp.]|jgi:antirestriction protein ArdC|nr:ssDNA-binding domain-containing protein [Desulfovibrio sp.]
MSQTPEKKNRFQVSREVQEEFVNSVAETMLKLAEKAGEAQKPLTAAPMEMPYLPTTGREYGGANMVRLMLTSMDEGYQDNRWITFKQLDQFQKDNPDLKMGVKKGEHGVKLLRPEEIFFTVNEDGKWKFHSQEEAREIEAQRKQGADLPPTQHKTLFYPFTVFNAEQIYGFPAKEQPSPAMNEPQRNDFVERFIASSGVAVDHHNGPASYSHVENLVKMPFPDSFANSDDYYAVKLREFYSATGHSSRENRQREPQTLKSQAFEEMRAEMFSMLAGAKLNLSMPENSASAQIANWSQKFSGGDVNEVFRAAADAAKMVTTMRQFEAGETPKTWWFPKTEEWRGLEDKQLDRYAAKGVFSLPVGKTAAKNDPAQRSERPALVDSVAAFNETDDPITKARLMLQNPDFLDMALKQDPNAVRDLASLCDTLSQTLHMELDEKSRTESAAHRAPEQQTAPAPRMRA